MRIPGTEKDELNEMIDRWKPNLNEYLREYNFNAIMAFADIVDDVGELLDEAFELGREIGREEQEEINE